MRKAYRLFLVIVTAVIILTAMTMDHSDEVMMQKGYCDAVNEGIHPNFKNLNCDGE